MPCYRHFNLAMGRSRGFRVCLQRLSALLRLAFAPAAPLNGLALPRKATRRLIMQKARRRPNKGSDRLQTHSFRFCFTPLSEVLFTFPSRYLFTIGLLRVFSLTGWCRQIQRGFHRPPPTQDTRLLKSIACKWLSHAMARLPRRFQSRIFRIMQVLQPRMGLDPYGLGFSAFARHYLRNHFCFLFLRVLRCFSSPGWLVVPCLQHGGLSHSDIRGSKVACTSPQLFAACRVLLSLQKPRHPLCALNYFSSYQFLQYVKELAPRPFASVVMANIFRPCGEYRSRTDDLLRAKQAL